MCSNDDPRMMFVLLVTRSNLLPHLHGEILNSYFFNTHKNM